jgi:NRPS condensation-like uncharacterized protein
MNEYDWYGLDNAAKIFPAISGAHTTSVYRIDVRLREPIDPVLLEEAVNTVLPSYPAFMVRMRYGLFWYYFEHNFEKALVREEDFYPTNRIDDKMNNGYLFRFSYFNNKINLDAFHALSDGTGAINFLTDVTACYLKLCGKQLDDSSELKENKSTFTAMQDSFAHFFSSGQAEKTKRILAYHIKGTSRPKNNVKIIHGILSAEHFKALAKGKNVTVTVYLAAVLAFAILETMPAKRLTQPVRLFIPINLRRFFETDTQRNFFTFVYIDISPADDDARYTFDALLRLVAEQMAERTKPEYFLPRLSYFIQTEKNIFTRVMPLVLKNLALRMIHRHTGDKTHTLTLSNLGKIDVPASVGDYIERFDVMTGNTRINHLNCVVCTYRDKLVVTFTKSDIETDVERYFFRFLSGQGLEIILEQN